MLDIDFEKLLKDIRENVFNKDYLNLSGQALKDEKIIQLAEALKDNSYIKKIDLSYNDIGDDGITAIAKIDRISELDIHNGLDGYDEYYNHITSIGAQIIAQSNLKKLNISGNLIGDDGFKFLAANRTIVELDVEGCGILADGAKEFFSINSTVIKLNLQANLIGDLGISTIASNNQLKELNVSNCTITHVGTKFIEGNTSLISLQMSGNIIGRGVCHLAKHIKLKSLNLSECEITDNDLELLATNNKIEELHLQYNKITSKGVKIIARNCTITILHLEHNNIYFDKETLQLLLSMKSLSILNGENNEVSEDVKETLEDDCSKSSLQHINLTIHKTINSTICLQYNAKISCKREAKRKAEELIASPNIKVFISQANQEQISDFIQEVAAMIKQTWEQEHVESAHTASKVTALRYIQ